MNFSEDVLQNIAAGYVRENETEIEKINPWRKVFLYIALGFILELFDINAGGTAGRVINDIVTNLGIAFMIYGFGMVRRNNRYFNAGFIICLLYASLGMVKELFVSDIFLEKFIQEGTFQYVYLIIEMLVINTLIILLPALGILQTVKNNRDRKLQEKNVYGFVWCYIYIICIFMSAMVIQRGEYGKYSNTVKNIAGITGIILITVFIVLMVKNIKKSVINLGIYGYKIKLTGIEGRKKLIMAAIGIFVIKTAVSIMAFMN